MRIQYASDLHLEFRENSEFMADNPLSVAGDILVLAGDITVFRGRSWELHPFFDWCAGNFSQTYIIPGNHEYYDGVELGDRFDNYEYALRPNVRYINNRTVKFGDTELFFTTLWSRVKPDELVPVQMGLTDCHRIMYNGKRFCSSDYETLHRLSMEWLRRALSESQARHKIVVTHHCPTEKFKDPRFLLSTINSAFTVPLDKFIETSGCDYWIYGHTHYNGGSGSAIGSTVLLSNQLGYVRYGEHSTFANNATIEL